MRPGSVLIHKNTAKFGIEEAFGKDGYRMGRFQEKSSTFLAQQKSRFFFLPSGPASRFGMGSRGPRDAIPLDGPHPVARDKPVNGDE